MGALLTLTEPGAWEGADADILLAQTRANLLQDILQRPVLYQDIPAPYWQEDTADDADDSAPADTQTWYGLWNSGTGFVDSLAGFVFTGFVAINFGAEAAVTFATTLTKFRLAFRTRNTGAILRVLLDGDTFALVDTYSTSPGEVTIPIASPGTTLVIQNTGTANLSATNVDGHYSMEIIRQRLSEADVAPPNIRYDPTSDHFQRTNDGGVTWTDSPTDDPRHSDTYRLPPLTGTGHECNSAARITAMWKETVDGFVATINQYTFATSVIALIVEFIPGAGMLIDLALIAFDLLAAVGTSLIESTFTDAIWHDIQCIISCYIQPNGQLSAEGMALAFAKIDSSYAGVVADTLHIIRGLYGEVFASNAGVERTEVGDCSDCSCEWCVVIDFRVTNGGFGVFSPGGVDRCYYQAGEGWRFAPSGDPQYIQMTGNLFDPSLITRVEFEWDAYPESVDTSVWLVNGGVSQYSGAHTVFTGVGGWFYEPTGSPYLTSALAPTIFDTNGYLRYFRSIKMYGVGTPPSQYPAC